MVKLSLWLGAPTVVTFLASSEAVRIENALLVFAAALIAFIFGIGPRLTGRSGH